MYYDNKLYKKVKSQFTLSILLCLSVFILFTAAAVIAEPHLVFIGALAIFLAGIAISFFLTQITALTIYHYCKFVNQLLHGVCKKTEASVLQISEEPVYRDNKLYFYSIKLQEKDKEYTVFYDESRGFPKNLNHGITYVFELHENYIVSYTN